VAFEREAARRADAEFLAPGHPLLDALADHFLSRERPVRAILADEKGRHGILWLYRARLQDGHGRPVLERLIALFHDLPSGEIRAVDPRMIWEMDLLPEGSPLPEDLPAILREASERVQRHVRDQLSPLQAEARARRERESAIKKRWLEASYEQLIHESQEKLWDYHRRREAGEDMEAAIRQEEQRLKELLDEKKKRLEELEKERDILILEPELEAVALIMPKPPSPPASPPAGAAEQPLPPDEEIKRRVEAAGMRVAMDYERQQGREPRDVSKQFLGYDIVSHGPEGTRYIEVKAFTTTGPLELTPHEWQMAERLQDAYWVYVVENALSVPRLHCIQNPAEHLSVQPITGIIKVVIQNWKGEI